MDKKKTIKFLWISMWATLLLMVVLKLTFNYYYPLVIENSKIITISKYIDNHIWLLIALQFIPYIFNGFFITLCVLQEKIKLKDKRIILILFVYIVAYPFKYINTWIAFSISLISYIILPLILTKYKRKLIFITFIIDNILQILSNFARGNNLIIQDTFIIELFMQIDYYLMFIIYYIGGIYMGEMTILPWFTKKETVINAKIEKLQRKIKKLEAKKLCLKKR